MKIILHIITVEFSVITRTYLFSLSRSNVILAMNFIVISDADCEAGYHCSSGECIDGKLLCNHVRNCRDGSDELNCRLSGTY